MKGNKTMQLSDRSAASNSCERAPARRLRSLVLAWHDEETGEDLVVDVRGSERFLEGLGPLGFVTVGPSREGSSVEKGSESANHRVRWTVRLSRYWKANRH